MGQPDRSSHGRHLVCASLRQAIAARAYGRLLKVLGFTLKRALQFLDDRVVHTAAGTDGAVWHLSEPTWSK